MGAIESNLDCIPLSYQQSQLASAFNLSLPVEELIRLTHIKVYYEGLLGLSLLKMNSIVSR